MADTHAHEGADLECFRRRVPAGRFGERCVMQPDAAQGAQQHVGIAANHRRSRVCPHGGGRGAIGIEIELGTP